MIHGANVAVMHKVSVTEEDKLQQEVKTMTYCQIIDDRFATYTTNDIGTEAKEDIVNCKEPKRTSAVGWTEVQ